MNCAIAPAVKFRTLALDFSAFPTQTNTLHSQSAVRPGSLSSKSQGWPMHQGPQHLVVIDAQVEAYATLAAGVKDAEVVVLDANRDGIAQITAVLRDYPNLATLQIVCHGEPGVLYLGNRQLRLDNCDDYAVQLQQWFQKSEPINRSLLLYSCNVAATGPDLLHRLHDLTGASVYAASTPVGHFTLGGNWHLDVRVPSHAPTPRLPFHSATLTSYPGILAPGDLDTSFDTDGIVTLDFNGGADVGRSVVVQADGKIVVAGYAFNGSNNDFAVTRYNSDGTLDTSFGGTGKILTPVGSGNDLGYSIAIQPDGKLVVAGYAFNGSNNDFAVTRYNSDGTLDTSFGSTGKLTTPIGSGNDLGYSVAIQADGKIVVAGKATGSNDDFALTRYNSNGTIDTSFGNAGKIITSIGSSGDEGQSVVIQPDGKVVVAGYASNGTNNDFALTRYNSNGTLDASFGDTGKVTTPIGANDEGYSVVIQPDGKLVVAGYAFNGSNNDFAVTRYNSDGTLDTSFGGTGKVTTPVGSANDLGFSIVIQPDGKLVVAGYASNGTNNDFALTRYNSDGTLDTSFGGTGKVITPINGDDEGYDVVLQPDGKIVLVGRANGDLAIVRYQGDSPAAPVVTGIADDTATVGDGITSDSSLTVSGTAVGNSTVEVFRNGISIGTTTANATGNWSITNTLPADGAYAFTAKATVSGSGTSPFSAAYNIRLDSVIATPVISSITTDSGIAGDQITNDGTLIFTGTAEANSSVQVFRGATSLGMVTANTSGNWTLDYSAVSLADGPYVFTATATDAAGNSATSANFNVTIDSTAPAAPEITNITTDTNIAGDRITSDQTLSLTGTAEAGSQVELFRDGISLGTVTASPANAWTFDYSGTTLANGSYVFTAKATDIAGNTSAASTAFNVTVDVTAPAAPTVTAFSADSGVVGDRITNDDTLLISGTAEANSLVELFRDNVSVGTVAANPAGNWTITDATVLGSGTYAYTAKATDTAGNTGAASTALSITVDKTAPAAPTVSGITTDTGASATDGITNDNTLIIRGTAEANNIVQILRNGAAIGTATADGAGNWSLDTTALPLANGTYAFTATATDAAGNTSVASPAFDVVVDRIAPTAPVISNISDDSGTAGDRITNDSTLILTGTAEANSSIELFRNGTSIGTATANGTGDWTFNYSSVALTDGSYLFAARATDTAGNVSAASANFGVQVDTVAPAAPFIISFSTDTGSPDRLTQDNTLTLSGTAVANSVIEILRNGVSAGTTTANAAGNWTFDYTGTTLPDGIYSFTATARDLAGNTSPAAATFSITVDTTAPAAPVLTTITTDTGNPTDRLTNDNRLVLAGTAEAFSSVELFQDGFSIGRTSANASGDWSFDHSATPLANGSYVFTAKATDAVGNVGPISTGLTVQVDLTAPLAPVITTLSDDSGIPADRITQDNTLIIGGTAEANSTVEVLLNGTAIGTATADGTGNWSFDYRGTPLSDGVKAFTARATDLAGNTGVASAGFNVTIDTTAPAAPVLTSFSDNTGSATDQITRDNTLILNGTAQANSAIKLFRNGVEIGTTTANAAGNWSYNYTGTVLTDATYTFTATATDAAGNTSLASAPFNITIDTVAPLAPAVTAISTDTGTPADGITNDNTLIISGTAENNGVIQVLLDGTAIGTTTADGTGNWSFDYTNTPIPAGSHSLTATATDAAGNTSPASAVFNLTIDATAPTAPAITSISDNTGLPNDTTTGDNTLTIRGTAVANSVIQVLLNGTAIGTTTADGSGNWSFDNTASPLADDTYSFTATASDIAGNVSLASAPFTVTVDTANPLTPAITGISTDSGTVGDRLTNDNTLIISGTAEANSTIQVFRDSIAVGTALTTASGTWSFDYSATVLADGSYAFTATATDVAGNVSPATPAFNVTIDRSLPATPTVTGISTDSGTANGTANDGITNDNTLLISGTASASSLIEVRQNGVVIGTTTTDASGTWLFDYTATTLPDGAYAITAVAINGAGNRSAVSAVFNARVDITAPAAPTVTAISDDTGIAGDYLTNDNRLIISGTAEANSVVQLFRDSNALGTATVNAAGNWSFDYTAIPLATGTYVFTATATDTAGNISALSEGRSVTIDITAPAVPVITSITDDSAIPADGITNDNTLIISGTADPNTSIQIALDGTAIGTTSTDATGNWSFDYTSSSIADGPHSLTAIAIDKIGNVSSPGRFDITIDTVAPTAPTITGFNDDSANSSDRITNDNRLTLVGTAPANSTIALFQNDTAIGTAIADTAGAWIFDYTTTPLADGVYSFTATLSDAVGNTASSPAFTITVDQTAPTPTLSSVAAAEVNAPFTVMASFNEPVSGFMASDLAIGNGTVSNFAAVSATTYRFTVTPITNGTVTVDVAANQATDLAGNGNRAATRLSRMVDIAPPATPPAPQLDSSSDTGISNQDGIIKDNTPLLRGIAEAGSTVQLFAGTALLGRTTADANGNWNFTPTNVLADGSYRISVTATDRLGNLSTSSSPLALQIDTRLAKAAIAEISPSAFDSSRDRDLDTITIRFTEAVANFNLADLKLTRDGVPVALTGATLTSSDNVTWTLSNLTSLTAVDGEFRLTLAVSDIIDLAGNSLSESVNSIWLRGRMGTALPAITFKGGKPGIKRQGSSRNEIFKGTWNNDVLQGKGGNDVLISGAGDFSYGQDRLIGGSGNDRLISGSGKDRLDGGSGNDYLDSGKSRDLLLGGTGDDHLLGRSNEDILIGGSGNDTLTGGSGRDTFVFRSATEGLDTITDFEVGKDLIDLKAIFAAPAFSGSTPFARFNQFVQLVQEGADTQIRFDIDGSGAGTRFETRIVLLNTAANTMRSTSFVV
jgi:large repetitive protein